MSGPDALFTDLYELTMAASYAAHGIDHPATFDLFVRRLPETRRFLVAAGLEQALDFLEGLSFGADELSYLASLGRFDRSFLDRLAGLRFTGDVWAVPEGEVVFGEEPLLELTAPLIEAQLVETFLINCVASQTMVASKAARVAIACGDRPFVDFSARRDHGPAAAMQAARASFIAGAAATSLVGAGRAYGIPLSGTMAHSYVMSFDDEAEAFRTYARDFPDDAVLLLDTYDTIAGARLAAQVAVEVGREGICVRGVRLDSGDLASLARDVRQILDAAGLASVQVFASGDLDEHRITELTASGAPVDAFGVGTQLGTSADAPSLGMVYKLVEDARGPRIKLSTGKATLPGRKQVYRADGHDVLALRDEPAGGRALLEPVMLGGQRTGPSPPLEAIQRRCRRAVATLPSRLRTLVGPEDPYEVRIGPGLATLAATLAGEREP